MTDNADLLAKAKVLSEAGALLLAEVYAAGELAIPGADGRSLVRAVNEHKKVEAVYVSDITKMPEAILDVAQNGDVVITMGAGSIGGVPARIVQERAQ